MTRADLLIVGGGLRGCLTALALAERCPDLDFLLVEQSARLGGGHIPPFFTAGLSDGESALVAALTVAEWGDYYLALPDGSRRLDGAMAWLVAGQIHAEIAERLPPRRYRLGARCVALDSGRAAFEDGGVVEAGFILDARGTPAPDVGGESWCHVATRIFEFAEAHQLDRPVLVDATLNVPGWSFLQYFPLAPRQLMIRYIRHSGSRAAIPVADRSGLNDAGRLIEESMAAWRISGPPLAGYREGARAALVRAPDAACLHPLLPSPVAAAARFATGFAELAARQPLPEAFSALEAARFGESERGRNAADLSRIALMTPAEIAALSG